jgi:pimeloyl-ACP methyl ester carboxylesterase
VGIGKSPPVFLKSGDEVTVSVTGLGKLTNKIASTSSTNYEVARVEAASALSMNNVSKNINCYGLTKIGGKFLNYQMLGNARAQPMVLVHGLGGSMEYWRSFIEPYESSHSIHLFDFEGHGLSPTSPLSVLSIASFAADLKGVFDHAGITSGATLVAHSMGCLIAMSFAISYQDLVKNLVLMGPPPSPLPEAGSKGASARAEKARTQGMFGVATDIATASTSESTKKMNPLAITAIRLSLLGQDPEGYAKACAALAGATTALEVEKINAKILIITGEDDKVSPPELCSRYTKRLQASDPVVLQNTGHWHVFESEVALSKVFSQFLSY